MDETATERFAYDVHTVRVVFGVGVLAELPRELERMGISRALLLTTPGRTDAAGTMKALLADRLAGVFDRARVHVPADVVREALPTLSGVGADCLLALGGGSAIGLGKALALETGAPLVAIPTTYSGSEMTAIWGTTEGGTKRTGRDPRVAPRTVVYDPALTVGLPAATSAASGMNAMAHAVEALYAVDGNPVTRLLATDGIRLLATSLPVVVKRPGDLAARGRALRGAHLAGWALELSSMGLHHRLCHVLGGSFGLPHAETHAALLPYVAAFNSAAAPEALRAVAHGLHADEAWTGLYALNRTLGLALSLKGLGLAAADLDRAADGALEQAYPNPRPLSFAGVRAVLQAAWEGRPPSLFG